MVRLDCPLVIWLSVSIFESFFLLALPFCYFKIAMPTHFPRKVLFFEHFREKTFFYFYAFIWMSSVPSGPITGKWRLFVPQNSVPPIYCKFWGQSWFSSTMCLDLLARTLKLPAGWEHWCLAEIIQFLVIGNHGWLLESDAQIHFCCDCF